MKRKTWITLLVLAAVGIAVARSGHKNNQTGSFPNDDRMRKIVEQQELIEQGNRLVEQEQYDEAILKYKNAMNPELLLHDYDIGPPIYSMSKALKFQGKYEEALSLLDEELKKAPNIKDGSWHEAKREIEALIRARDSHSSKPIYEYIQFLRTKYKQDLPPNASGYSDVIAAKIILLYDQVGDMERGANFVKEFLKSCVDGITCLGDDRNLAYTPRYSYYPIYQAFLEDIKENSHGRATKALMQSDRFSW